MERIRGAVVCHSLNRSPDLRETLVSCFGHSAFLQHIVADITEHLELLNAGQFVGIITLFHHVDHHTLAGDHWVSPLV